MTILELREKRAKAWEATKAFLDSHRNDKGMLSAEDDATYSRMEQEITDLGKEIARLERQEALEAELNRPVNKPLTGKPMNGKETAKTGRATDEYRQNFWNMMRSKSPMPTVMNALQIGTDSEGGYLVPDEYRAHPGRSSGGGEHLPPAGEDHPDLQRRPQDPRGGYQGYRILDR